MKFNFNRSPVIAGLILGGLQSLNAFATTITCSGKFTSPTADPTEQDLSCTFTTTESAPYCVCMVEWIAGAINKKHIMVEGMAAMNATTVACRKAVSVSEGDWKRVEDNCNFSS